MAMAVMDLSLLASLRAAFTSLAVTLAVATPEASALASGRSSIVVPTEGVEGVAGVLQFSEPCSLV